MDIETESIPGTPLDFGEVVRIAPYQIILSSEQTMTPERNSFHFDFTVTGISADQAAELLDLIIERVVDSDGKMGGGYAPTKEDDHDEDQADPEALGQNGA